MMNFPPGYEFVPTDSLLISYYLMKKINNQPHIIEDIRDVDIYKFHPQTLSETYPSRTCNKIKEWFFYTPRSKKYPKGKRPDRAAGGGFWKASGADKKVVVGEGRNERVVGFKKSLVFYEGTYKEGRKTNWLMNEYTVEKPTMDQTNANDMKLDDWVLCRIYNNYPKSKKANYQENEQEDLHYAQPPPSIHHHLNSSFDHNTYLQSSFMPQRGLVFRGEESRCPFENSKPDASLDDEMIDVSRWLANTPPVQTLDLEPNTDQNGGLDDDIPSSSLHIIDQMPNKEKLPNINPTLRNSNLFSQSDFEGSTSEHTESSALQKIIRSRYSTYFFDKLSDNLVTSSIPTNPPSHTEAPPFSR